MAFNAKDICRRLLEANSEEQVTTIIESSAAMAGAANWRPLDGRETNFNITSNQASDGGKALTELMTNMVDAVLMRHAAERDIDPRSPEAPQTMYEAVDRLVHNLHGGKLTNLGSGDHWLKDFSAKNLIIGVTGARSRKDGLPCYVFVDNGEGQRPEDFHRTFLSLSAGTKSSIPFVQGKYNMGSSGVLGYCGRRWYKLIVSRRYDGKGPWGWTIVRRRPGGPNDMPVAEYFSLADGTENGTIPTFEQDMLHPFRTGTGKQYADCALRTGTVIKLFDYNVGSKHSGFRGAREALNENLVETILPFRILDFRWKPDPSRGGDRAEGIDARPFYGMEFLLLRQHKEDLRDDEEDAGGESADDTTIDMDSIHVGDFSNPDIGRVSVYGIPLRPTDQQPEWLRKTNNKVFHAVNGQVQFKQTRGFLSTTCKLPALKDRLIVIVDASNMTFGAHNEIWKGDREHVRETTLGQRYKELVAVTIRESKVLKDLQHQIAQQELKKATEVQSNALFQKLVTADPSLAALLSNRMPTIRMPSAGGSTGQESGTNEFAGKYSPTFLRVEEKLRDVALEIPLNRTRPLTCRTDAENGYLRRVENRGRVIFSNENVAAAFNIREHLHDGRLTIFLEPSEEQANVGDTFDFAISLRDDAMVEPVSTEHITVRIVADEADPKKRKPKDKTGGSGSGGKGAGTGTDAPNVGLPACVLLREHGEDLKGYTVERWPAGFTQNDGGVIDDLGDGEIVYKINYDNAYHLKTRYGTRGQVERDVVTEKYILGMRVLLLGMEQAYRAIKAAAGDRGEQLEEFADDIRRIAARGAASTVLTLAEHLPTIVDKSAITEEVE